MPWPLSQDYNEAIQTPSQCFADAELRQGEAVTSALGLPIPCSGNFADVYAVQYGHQKWAVKCFTRQIPGLRERYAEISKYLQQVQLPFMVDFKFLEQGIRVRGQWFPALKMQWVEGQTLNTFVRNQLNNSAILKVLCQLWVKMAVVLRQANLAHGDLQHGNVLLVPGSKSGTVGVRLVDYDGMCVPTLELLKSMEVGHPAYQHPQRLREGTYGLHIDRFSNLVIYTALRSLLVGGRNLWERFDNGDNLLFTQKDFENPRGSGLFQELLKLNDPELMKLVQALSIASQKPVEQAPLLDDLVAPETVKAASNDTKVPVAATAPQSQAPRRTGVSVAASAPAPAQTNWSAAKTSESSRYRRQGRRSNVGLVLGLCGILLVAAAVSGFVFLVGRNKDDGHAQAIGSKASLLSSPTAPRSSTSTVIASSKTARKVVDKLPALVIECGRGWTDATQEEKITPGYGYTLIGGRLYNDGGWHCWFDQEKLCFDIAVPPGISGTLSLFCFDGGKLERKQRITVQGYNATSGLPLVLGLSICDDFGGSGKDITVPISEEATTTGKISVVIENQAGKANAVVSTVKLFPATPYNPAKQSFAAPEQQYLAEVKETDFKVQHATWFIGKGNLGNPGNPTPIVVSGRQYPRGLGMHPPSDGYSFAKYAISGKWDRLVVRTALNDTAARPKGSVVFQVLGDGKVLWASRPVQEAKIFQGDTVSVKGISTLELRTICSGREFECHAVWLDPYLVR